MSKKLNSVRSYRIFTEAFKRQLVSEYESKKFTISELSRIYKISATSLYQWVYKYSSYLEKQTKVVELKESTTKKLKEYESRIKELEQVVGQKQMQIDYFKAIVELASEEYNIDLKKTLGTQP